jgi:hypothetical protein
MKRGIRFANEIDDLFAMVITNNTFYETERPIEFEQMPHTISNELKLFQNLFLEATGDELRVATGLDPEQSQEMYHMLTVGNNWSDRPSSGKPPAEGEMNIFLNGGKQGDLGIEFLSTDPADRNFLKPKMKRTLLPRPVRGRPTEAKPYIGAVDPRPNPAAKPSTTGNSASQANRNKPQTSPAGGAR